MLMAISPLQPNMLRSSSGSSSQASQVAPINPNTTLCLACSSSLPPRSIRTTSSTSVVFSPDVFLTRCCSRPICPSCLEKNPRLSRYDPCLACLGGVGAVGSKSLGKLRSLTDGQSRVEVANIDGAVRDEDVFAIGDEDEEDEGGSRTHEAHSVDSTPPPAYVELSEEVSQTWSTVEPSLKDEPTVIEPSDEGPSEKVEQETTSAPSKYYIKPGDTLTGIALRFGIDGRTLCRLNNLPASTLSTTPHVLHTRTFLTLPPSHKLRAAPSPEATISSEEHKERERSRKLEQARKRFQFVTKEVDWRVAKAYVAVADHDDEHLDIDFDNAKEAKALQGKDTRQLRSGEGLEGRAVDRYLDDDDWENEAGGRVSIQRFPGTSTQTSGGGGSSSGGIFNGWFRK